MAALTVVFQVTWMLRRTVISFCATLIDEESAVRALLIVLVLGGSAVVIYWISPYEHPLTNSIEVCSLVVLLCGFASTVVAQYDEESTASTVALSTSLVLFSVQLVVYFVALLLPDTSDRFHRFLVSRFQFLHDHDRREHQSINVDSADAVF